MFRTPKGTVDILPADWPWWDFVMSRAIEVATLYGYRRIETPTFSDTELFTRTTGQSTDIVEKEMFTLKERSDEGESRRSYSLRPEGTAPVMRAYFEHGMHKLPQPVKLYYLERMYRAENPQRGRLREHHQFGCEAIGSDEPYVDVEMLALLCEFYARLGLKDISLHVNSIGDQNCRPGYIAALRAYLEQHIDQLAPQDRERLERNTLRVLDSKEHTTQPILPGAPKSVDYLCDDCRRHWEGVQHGLQVLGISYVVDHRLVRGLDYYTRTVFEFLPAQGGSIGAGGRYDALAEAMGEAPVPGIGFGSGIERLILAMEDEGAEGPDPEGPRVYVIHAGEGTADAALRLTTLLRRSDVSAVMSFGESSFRAQLRHADRAGARYAAIIGESELASCQVTIRNLQSGEQRTVSQQDLIEAVSPLST